VFAASMKPPPGCGGRIDFFILIVKI